MESTTSILHIAFIAGGVPDARNSQRDVIYLASESVVLELMTPSALQMANEWASRTSVRNLGIRL
jgi:hypothetical protein